MQQLIAGTVHPRSRLGFLIATLAVAFCAAPLHAQTTPTLAVSLSPTSPQYTDTITVTATVTGSGTPQPTGTVTYSVDGGSTASASITQTGAKGIAYFPIVAQAPGSHTVAVSYSGDSNYNPVAAQTQSFTVADRALQLNSSTYDLHPITLYASQGDLFYNFGATGVAVDANFNVYIAFGASSSEAFGNPPTPAIDEITGNGLYYQSVPVTGLGTDPRLAVDSTGNLYIADPTNARVVEYSTAGVQTNLAVTGLASPTTVTYDSASGSLFILDSTLGGVIQFNLSTHTQTTIFSGVTGLDPALAVDGSGGIYYAVGNTVMFRAPNGTTSPVYTEDNAGPLAPQSPYSEQITGLAFDAVHQSLWFGTTLWFANGMAFELLDSSHHASFIGFDDANYGQLSLDSSGAAYTPRVVFTNNPVAANVGPVIDTVSGNDIAAFLQLPYAQSGSTGAYYSRSTVDSFGSLNTEQVGLGPISFPSFPVTLSNGSTFTIPVYGIGYGAWTISDPGPAFPLASTPFEQPAGLAYAMPQLGGLETTYISDEGSNTVSSVIFIGSNYGQTSGPSIQSHSVLGFTGLVSPSQVAADGNGDVWVLDQGAPSGGSRVVRLDSSGNQTVPYTASAGDPLGLVQDVAAFAVDGPQDLYLGGSHNGSGVIVKIDPLGLETQVASGIGVPAAIAVDALYTVYTVDASTGTLLKIDRLGNKTTVATGLPAPTEISLDPAGTVYLSSATGKGVLTIAPDGTQKTIVLAGIANPAVAVADYFGNIQVADGVTKLPYVASRFNVDVNFGSVAPNASATQDFAISNIGNLSAGALTPSVQQGTYTPFSAASGVTNGCQFSGTGSPTLLAPAQSCHIQFQYSPTKAGTDTAIGTVSASNPLGGDSGGGTTNYWELSGTASVAAPAPVPVLTPSALDFGSLTVGTASSAQTATLSNTGNAALTVSSIAITGANAGSFSETNTCGASVAASASCSIAVTCKPSAAGEQTATLAANYPSPLAQQTVALTCDGTAATAPVAALTPASLTFTTVAGSTPAAQTATLTNSGNAALSIGSIAIGGANAASFTQTNTCGASLAAGANCAITVSFAGTTVGSYAATLTVTDNSATPTQTAALSATVTAASAPAAALTPASLTYSATAGATSAAQTATLTNSGNATLNISGITLTGANASDFALSAKTCGATLASGASCTISVTFTPNAAGSFAAAISVADDAPGSPQTSALSGTGTAAPAAPDFTVTAAPATQSVSAGSAATYTVSVASTGGSFTSAVALTAAGLPSGMTVAFSPASVTPGAAGGQSVMTVQTAAQQTASSRQPPQGRFSGAMAAPAFAAVLLLIPGWRARRRWNSKAGRAYFTGAGCLLILLGMMGAITGCGGGFALQQASATSYTITVTGTSGSVQHSTSVQITVR